MDAPVLYAVRIWLDPAHRARVIAWLDGGHQAEVTSQPGFLWSRRYRLAEDAKDGWHAYVALYGLRDRGALDAYAKNPIREKFARESAPFEKVMRIERFTGMLDLALPRRG